MDEITLDTQQIDLNNRADVSIEAESKNLNF